MILYPIHANHTADEEDPCEDIKDPCEEDPSCYSVRLYRFINAEILHKSHAVFCVSLDYKIYTKVTYLRVVRPNFRAIIIRNIIMRIYTSYLSTLNCSIYSKNGVCVIT